MNIINPRIFFVCLTMLFSQFICCWTIVTYLCPTHSHALIFPLLTCCSLTHFHTLTYTFDTRDLHFRQWPPLRLPVTLLCPIIKHLCLCYTSMQSCYTSVNPSTRHDSIPFLQFRLFQPSRTTHIHPASMAY